MTLRIIGAGIGRTGTLSLKHALERLLGGPCYHMLEAFPRPDHVAAWHAAAEGRTPDWHALLADYVAAVDWPASAFWPELQAAWPDAPVVLSVRDPESWWRSASDTIFPATKAEDNAWRRMVDAMFASRFVSDIDDKDACIAAFEAHNAGVRAGVAPNRLIEWQAADGWEPLCAALGVPVPAEPFPHVNSTEEFRQRNAS